jgi:nucleoside-diphosphate-sugar epimerase
MKKKYLVTGGTGFIGSDLVRALLNLGHEVRVFDNNSRGVATRLKGLENDIEVIAADIRDYDAVQAAVCGVDAVIHLAYINGTEFFYSKPQLVLDVGIKGMLNVIDACVQHNVTELSLASSSEVYQNAIVVPTPEDTPLVVPDILNPRYSYGGGKIACELIAINYGRDLFEKITIFRPHNIYGPDMGWEHVIPQLTTRAMNQLRSKKPNSPFKILGDGEQQRAFCFIDDFTMGVIKILENGKHLGIYHIGNPEEVKISKVAKTILRRCGLDVEFQFESAPKGEVSRRCPDISKMQAIGFAPVVDFETGIKKTVDWYVQNYDLYQS